MTSPKIRPLSNEEISFTEVVKQTCRDNGIKFTFKDKEGIKIDGVYIAGYFDGDSRELVVAARRADFIDLLIHESCHMDQFIEKVDLWNEHQDKCTGIDGWLKNEEVPNINHQINVTKKLELDCEKRSVDKIVKYNLPVNVEIYIQKANAYIQFYNYIKKSRRWNKPGFSPYSREEIYSHFPSRFMSDEWYRKLPNRLFEIFKKNGL